MERRSFKEVWSHWQDDNMKQPTYHINPNRMKRQISIILILLGLTGAASGQEVNFSRVQDMTIWYNQSLKTEKQNTLNLNYRSVQFGGQIAYNSVAAMFSMPILSKEAK